MKNPFSFGSDNVCKRLTVKIFALVGGQLKRTGPPMQQKDGKTECGKKRTDTIFHRQILLVIGQSELKRRKCVP